MTEPMKLADVLREIEERIWPGTIGDLDVWAAAIRQHLALDEARDDKIAEILESADGHCSHCARDLAEKYEEAFPDSDMKARVEKEIER